VPGKILAWNNSEAVAARQPGTPDNIGVSGKSASDTRCLLSQQDPKASEEQSVLGRRFGVVDLMVARAKRVQQAGATAGSAHSVPPPTELPAPGWLNVFKRIWHSFSEDRILALAAGVAFYGMLALYPAIGSLVALYGFVADPSTIAAHVDTLNGVLPQREAYRLAIEQFNVPVERQNRLFVRRLRSA
jgi:hypothetical protein